MHVRFLMDPDTDEPHIYNHGVREDEALEVLEHASVRLHGHQGALIALGQTLSGRYLRVIYKLTDEGYFVITAFDLRGKALQAFRRRLRRKAK